jgi:hypothetical protein
MLAYVFWHRPERHEGYESALIEFHAQLARARLPFLFGSAAYRVSGLPWIEGGDGYEDWYLVPGFADLGRLNEAAVSERFKPAHDAAASRAAWGIGGLYAPVRGEPPLRARTVSWLSKPRGTTYDDFFASLPDVSFLARRQMTLGPTPEFCATGELEGGLIVERAPLF